MRTVFLFVLATTLFLGSAANSADPEVDMLVQKITAAYKGQDKLLKLFQFTERLNVTSDPTKKGNERTSIVEPPKYWWIGKAERGVEPAKFLVWAWTLGALTDPASSMTTVPEVIESDRPAFGLRISGTIDPPMDLYFDKENYRLVRIDWRDDIHRFAEWQDTTDMIYPAKCIGYKKATGKPWYFSEILELKRLTELPQDLQR